jgi:hypothetical protein
MRNAKEVLQYPERLESVVDLTRGVARDLQRVNTIRRKRILGESRGTMP